MNADQIARQEQALRAASEASPLALYAGRLRGQADELRDVLKALAQAEGDEIEGAEVVSAAMLAQGVRIYWPNEGAGKVLRTANGYTGIQVEWDSWRERPDPVSWVNVLGGATPVVVIP